MLGTSIILYFVFILIYDAVTYTHSYHTVLTIIGTHYFYFVILCNVSIVCVVDVALTIFWKTYWPTQSDILVRENLELNYQANNDSKTLDALIQKGNDHADNKIVVEGDDEYHSLRNSSRKHSSANNDTNRRNSPKISAGDSDQQEKTRKEHNTKKSKKHDQIIKESNQI